MGVSSQHSHLLLRKALDIRNEKLGIVPSLAPSGQDLYSRLCNHPLSPRPRTSTEAIPLPAKTTPTLIMLQSSRARIFPILLIPPRAHRTMPVIIRPIPRLPPHILAPAKRPTRMSPLIRLRRVQQCIFVFLLISAVFGAAIIVVRVM